MVVGVRPFDARCGDIYHLLGKAFIQDNVRVCSSITKE